LAHLVQLSPPVLLRWLPAAQAVVLVGALSALANHFAPGAPSGPSCRTASVADAAAVSQLLISTVPGSDGVRLQHARASAIGRTGMYFLGARIIDGTGRSIGIGVWRIIGARNTLGLPADVATANPVAEMLTPDLSRLAFAGSAGPPDCLLTQ
jgi:hypothetical protein